MTREQISKELDRQAMHEGETPNVAACRAILRRVGTGNEWQTLVSVGHLRYGPLSYEVHRFYYVRSWVLPLAAELMAPASETLPASEKGVQI